MKGPIKTIFDTFSPLRISNLRIYFAGQSVSLIGTWMQATAQSWVVWQLSRSTVALGFVAMLLFAPFIVFGPLAGVWADRIDRRRLLISTQVAAMILAVILAYLVQFSLVQLWHVYVLAALLGIVNSFDMPAQQAFIGDLSGIENLRKAVTINGMIIQVSRMIGPALAGVIISLAGVAAAFWINAASFVAVIISLAAVSSHQVIRKNSGSSIRDFADALKFIKSQPRILDLLVLTFILTFFGFSIIQIIPAVITDVLHGDAGLLGLLLGASGAGALVGSVILVPLLQRVRQSGLVVGYSVLWAGLWFILFSGALSPFAASLCIFMSALTVPTVLVTTNTLLQLMSPGSMKGRVLSVLVMLIFGIQPVASLMIGYTAHYLGPSSAIAMNGALIFAGASLVLLLRPEIRHWKFEIPAPNPAEQ